jgi:hypothetical protein
MLHNNTLSKSAKYASFFPCSCLSPPAAKRQSPFYAPYVLTSKKASHKKCLYAIFESRFCKIKKEFDQEGFKGAVAGQHDGASEIQAYYFGVRFYNAARAMWLSKEPADEF